MNRLREETRRRQTKAFWDAAEGIFNALVFGAILIAAYAGLRWIHIHFFGRP